MLNKVLEHPLHNAFVFAREHRHEFMSVEHLLLALLDNSAARDALKACGADIEAIKSELLAFVKDTTPLILDDQLNERETQPTLGFQRVLQRAVFHVQSSVRTSYWRQRTCCYIQRARVSGRLYS